MPNERHRRPSAPRGRLAAGVAAFTALVSLALVAGASPASADQDQWETQSNGVAGVQAWGTDTTRRDDDQVDYSCSVYAWVKDTRLDGHRVGVRIRHTWWDGSRDYYFIENTGGGNTTVNGSAYIPSIWGGSTVEIQEYVADGPPGPADRYIARGGWNRICT